MSNWANLRSLPKEGTESIARSKLSTILRSFNDFILQIYGEHRMDELIHAITSRINENLIIVWGLRI